MLFGELDHHQLSLQDCCNDLAQHHQKLLSKVALHKRFNSRSFDFLKAVLAEQMASKLHLADETVWQPFNKVIIADSCKFALPQQFAKDYPAHSGNRARALMNMQYSFDLKHGNWEGLELTKGTENDMKYTKRTLEQISKGDLHIRDLGYLSHAYLRKIVKEEAFFISRLHPLWNPVLCDTGKKVDWVSLYEKMKKKRAAHFETMIVIGKGRNAFNCRLIAVPVPEEVWAERIRKAQARAKSVGYQLTDEYKHRCRFSLFLTNTSQETLNSVDISQLYRLRWQIELVFKTWKSLFDIHKVKVVKKERLECHLIAKFIWILINWKVFRCIDAFIRQQSPDYACSMWKFFKQTRKYNYILRMGAVGKLQFADWSRVFLFNIKSLLIEPKKGKKAGFVIVYDIFNP
jgi:IS4 transposase